jgi:hypothetical protein
MSGVAGKYQASLVDARRRWETPGVAYSDQSKKDCNAERVHVLFWKALWSDGCSNKRSARALDKRIISSIQASIPLTIIQFNTAASSTH